MLKKRERENSARAGEKSPAHSPGERKREREKKGHRDSRCLIPLAKQSKAIGPDDLTKRSPVVKLSEVT